MEELHCIYCGKVVTKDDAHTVTTEDGQTEVHYCCAKCRQEHESQEDPEAKKDVACEFC